MNAVFGRRVDHFAGVLRFRLGRMAFLELVPFSQPFYGDENGQRPASHHDESRQREDDPKGHLWKCCRHTRPPICLRPYCKKPSWTT
jgi:hypothetical protein